MYVTAQRKSFRGLRRGLGTVSTPVGGSLVFGSNPIATPISRWGGNPVRALPITGSGRICPAWGCDGPEKTINTPYQPISPGSGWQSGSGSYSGGGYGGRSKYNGGGYGNGSGWNATSASYGSQPTSQALQVAQALLASNPSLLTQEQFTLLQQAGLISTSLPYSSVSQITPTAGTAISTASSSDASELAAAQAGTSSSSDIGSTLSATYAGLPLYLWLLIGGGAAFLFMGRSGRR